jgi:hypothetical protein
MRLGKLLFVIGLVAVVACPLVARADIAGALNLQGLTNRLDFVNREVIIRGTADSWAVIDPVTQGGIQSGDLVVSVFRGQDLTVVGENTPSWTAGTDGSANPYLNGYSVTEVLTTFGAVQYKAPTWDPFGKLNVAAGETLRVFDAPSDWVVDGVGLSLQDSVDSATNGSLFAAFTMVGGYGSYVPLNPVDGSGQAGLMKVANDGGSSDASGITYVPFSPSAWQPDTDLSARITVIPNQNGPYAAPLPPEVAPSPWQFESYGPVYIQAVPEPGTLALWGGCLALGLVALRRRKK